MSTPQHVNEASRRRWKTSFNRIYVRHAFAWSCAITAIVLFLDYVTGPDIHFPITYLIPVSLAAWSLSVYWAIALGVAMSLIRLGFTFIWRDPFPSGVEVVNTAIVMFVLLSFALLLARHARVHRALSREVEVLEGMLPICSFCKKIRNQAGRWEPLESYITDRSKAHFSHGVCPECVDQHYGDIMQDEP